MSLITALVESKVAGIAVALGTIAVGGTTASAYSGTLPEPLQQLAHVLVAAPAPSTVLPHPLRMPHPGRERRPSGSPARV